MRSPLLLFGAGVPLVLACGGLPGGGGAPAQEAAPPATPAPPAADAQPPPDAAAPPAGGGCDPMPPPPLPGPGCLAGTLTCGQTLRSTTEGGSDAFDGARYLASYCFPTARESHGGPERAYRFELPAGQRARIRLESPCGTLALAALRWEAEDRCPDPDAAIAECEGRTGYGTSEVRLSGGRDAAHYLVVVDGMDGEALPFALSATCEAPPT